MMNNWIVLLFKDFGANIGWNFNLCINKLIIFILKIKEDLLIINVQGLSNYNRILICIILFNVFLEKEI